MKKISLRYYSWVCIVLMTLSMSAQQVTDYATLAVQSGDLDPYTARFEVMGNNHYLYFSNGKNQVALFDGDVYEGYCTDSIIEYKRRDFHMLRFDGEFNVTNNLVIDNVEENFHVMTHTDDAHVFLFHFDDGWNNDSLASMKILPNVEIPRADHLGASLLIMTDSELNYVKHVFPTTGEITQIKGSGESVYMNINMAADEDFILLNNDTVHNFRAQFGRENHIVLAKYNLRTESFDWWYRPFGNFINMYSNGLEVDGEGNCYQLVMTDANIYLSNGDTTRFGEYYAPVLLKFDPNGNIIWHVDFDETEAAFLVRLSLDKDNNAYVDGSYYGSKLTIGDTVLYANKPNEYSEYSPCVLTKISKDGNFHWAKQLNGTAYLCDITNVISDDDGNIYARGQFTRGSVTFNGITYHDIDIRRNYNEFIIKINPETGADLGHVVIQGDVRIRSLGCQNNKLFAQFELRDDVEIFGQTFSTSGNREVFIVKISELLSGVFNPKQSNAAMVKVFPNPIPRGEDIVVFSGSSKWPIKKYMLIDAQGLIVDAGNWDHQMESMRIPVHGAAGQYTLLVHDENNYETIKLLIN